MKKNKITLWLSLFIAILCIILVIIYSVAIAAPIKIDIGFQKSPLQNIASYTTISGIIVGDTPIDINLNNVFIEDNSITATAFEQNYPLKNITVNITESNNNYIMKDFNNNKETGIFKFILDNTNIIGTFKDLENHKIYPFKGSLYNYNSGSLSLINEKTLNEKINKIFIDYPFYNGYCQDSKTNEKIPIFIAYNEYTNKLIEFSKKNSNQIYTLKSIPTPNKIGIRLDEYYKDKLIGFYNLIYNKGNWTGSFTNISKKTASKVIISGSYKLNSTI